MTKKLLLSMMICFVLIFVTSVMSNAQSTSPIELPLAVKEHIGVYVVLENLGTGQKILLNPYLVDFQSDSFLGGSNTITYDVGIASSLLSSAYDQINQQSLLLPAVAYAVNEQVNKCDSTSSVCATLTFVYHEGQQNGTDYMYADQVKNIWIRNDPQVSWSNGKIKATCRAEWLNASGLCDLTNTGTISNPVSGAIYSIVPTFAGSNKKTIVDDINYQLATQSISLSRGGNNWNFSFCIVNGGGSLIYGCY